MDSNNRENAALPVQVTAQVNITEVINAEKCQGNNHKPASHIRFTEREWKQLQNDRVVTGRSIPELLKNRYFKHGPLSTLMSPAAQDYMATELRRIGNNFNQVAKVLNSGFREGWNTPLLQIRDDMAALRLYVAGIYGRD